MSDKNSICYITRKAINEKIDSLSERTKMSLKNLDDKYALKLQAYKDLIAETTKNTNDILINQQKKIDKIYEKLQKLDSIITDTTIFNEKIKSIKKDVEDIEKIIPRVSGIDKDLSVSKSDIEHLSNCIESLKKDIEEMEKRISGISDEISQEHYHKLPKIAKLYDNITKYKYTIIGMLIILVLLMVDASKLEVIFRKIFIALGL